MASFWMVTWCLCSLAPCAWSAQWSSLFNGENLDGWIKRGGNATYEVSGQTIIGTTRQGGANTFLCTYRDFGDFILEL